MPWAALVVTLGARSVWRSQQGEWAPFPEIALRGPATSWSFGRDDDGPVEYVVALIEPFAIPTLFGIAAADACDCVIDVRGLWRDADLLIDRLRACNDPESKVDVVAGALRVRALGGRCHDEIGPWFVSKCRQHAGSVDVARAAQEAGCSERWFRARVRDAIGMGAKRWACVERFSAALTQLHGNPWDSHRPPEYCDQSHQVREFRALSGLTPGRYRAEKSGGDRRIFLAAA